MRRRTFIEGLGLAAFLPMLAHAQQQAMPVIGFVASFTLKQSVRYLARVREGLAEGGYVEGKNFRLEFREANNKYDLFPTLYRELADQKVSVILTDGTLKLEAAKAATQSIPIVFLIGVDPVENGFVASLNKPGGNLTGTFIFAVGLGAKQLRYFTSWYPQQPSSPS